ncbi:MAG: polysaccharide biosynthesis protein [Lachnospiraceae bacterium]|nr:polysaccharide biosynthesis protein [Lachnospiraceae bacterium]
MKSIPKSSLKSLSLAHRPLVRGTLILTITGLITRLIGFFYRIYLSRLFGEEGMGIYQLLAPVLALSFSLCAAAYQTAISKFVAEYTGQNRRQFLPLYSGLLLSLPLSLLALYILYGNADLIAVKLLLEPRTAPMLRILAFSIPFSSVHACINGYFYGVKRTAPPAVAQLLEQLTRVGCVYLTTSHILSLGKTPSINVAVFGLTIGEMMSMCVCLFALFHTCSSDISPQGITCTAAAGSAVSGTSILRPAILRYPRKLLLLPILRMALPLTLNRIVLNLLQSIESVSIPARLRLYGYDNATALSVYGVLTGMAMPMIFFPNALTNSVSVLLLPVISESAAKGDMKAVRSAVLRTIKFCAAMGITFLTFFLLTGHLIGETLFDSTLAGHFITTLSFLCPFLYLDVTLSSVLQGLGKAGTIFFMNVLALLIRLGFVFLAVPQVGITGYLWGILSSQMILSLLYLLCLRHFFRKHA